VQQDEERQNDREERVETEPGERDVAEAPELEASRPIRLARDRRVPLDAPRGAAMKHEADDGDRQEHEAIRRREPEARWVELQREVDARRVHEDAAGYPDDRRHLETLERAHEEDEQHRGDA